MTKKSTETLAKPAKTKRLKSVVGKPKPAAKPNTQKTSKDGIKRTPQHEKFIESVVSGKKQTDAYTDAYPNSSRSAARNNASRLMADDSIYREIEERKKQAARSAKVTIAQVMGATAAIAFADIRDVHDSLGYFDYQKACSTGAIALVKKISRTQNQFGENIAVEFYDKKGALDRLGDYLGMKQSDRPNDETLEKVVASFQIWLEDNPQASAEQKAVWVQRFARGGGVEAKTLGMRVGVEIQEIGQVQ